MLTVGAAATEAEAMSLGLVRKWATDSGAVVEHAPDLPRAIRRLALDRWDLVCAALSDRPHEELAWWADVLRRSEGSPKLVALATHPSMSLAIQSQKLGVLELLSLSLRPEDFARVLQGLHGVELERPIELPHVEVDQVGPHAMVGQHPIMLDVYKLIVKVAPSNATVLLQGDSGTGKEVVARALHQHGARASGPFVAVNCAAIPENLLESELFGHEKGAFTGAVAKRAGKFEMATGGTLFLDEVADMSLALQAKVLRAVQEREVERVGGSETISVDVRLVAATNRNLRTAIDEGKFREDLYYRLAIVTIDLPRLATRGDDLLLLAAHFAGQFGPRYGKSIRAISDRALALLRRHPWKGNVRELRNVIERAVVVASDDTLRVEHLPDEIRSRAHNTPPGTPVSTDPARRAEPESPPSQARNASAEAPVESASQVWPEDAVANGTATGVSTGAAASSPLLATLAETEAQHIARVLAHTGGIHGAAAEILGIHRNTLARKVKEYGLQ